jgi:succinate dehydrogenase / fumarate reductase membrane anchor subunit
MSRRASGLRAWILQRISAVYLGVFTPVLLWHFLSAPPADYLVWRAWVALPWVSIGLFLYVTALMVHSWVGIRDVLIDYVHPLAIRVTLLTLFGLLFLGSALWALQAIFLAHVAP